MRCQACNAMLDEFESVRKNKATGEYYDLCSPCLYVVKETIWETEEAISLGPQEIPEE